MAATGPSQLAWTLLLTGVTVLALAVDMAAPTQLGAGALVVIPVLAAAWSLGGRALAVVILAALAVEVASVILGRLQPLPVGSRLVAIAVVAAVGRTAAVSFAEARRARQREVGALLRSSRVLSGVSDQRDVVDEAVRVVAGTLAAGAPGQLRIAMLSRIVAGHVNVLAAQGPAAATINTNTWYAPAWLPAESQQVLADGRPRVLRTADMRAGVRDGIARTGIVTWALARVLVGGEPFGLLSAGSADPAGFGEEDLRLLDGIARVSGLAIGAALRQTELVEVKQRLQQNVELALEVSRSLEPSQVRDSVLVRLTRSLDADQATLASVDGRDLVVEATYRAGSVRRAPVRCLFSPELVERVPALARALATCEPAAGGPLEVAPGAEELAQLLPTGAHTLILPYVVDGRAAHVFALGRDEGRAFDDDDVAQLARMADVAALALRNATRHAMAERQGRVATTYSDSLEHAIEAAEEIGSAGELEDAVERARLLAVAAARADRGNISRLEGDDLVVEHDHRPSLPYARRRPVSRSRMSAEAIRTRRAVYGRVGAGAIGPDGLAWMVPAGILHAMQCPLIVGGEVVGLLGFGRSRDEPFTDADAEALLPFATLTALLLQNARRLAEARLTGQVRSQYMTVAAHELRTPLAVIRGYLSMLEDGTYPVPDRTRIEAVETLVSKAQELESLVESLVMAARLEGGTVPRAVVELDMREVVGEAMERVRPRARLERALVTVRAQGPWRAVLADRIHVARILDNLLNNALTYSPVPAEITIEVCAGDMLEVAVRDTGHGIPPDQHERVFERFHRADVGPARTSAGLGLGLTISRELAHLNGGQLVLDRSAPGEGSVFVLRLPVASGTPPAGIATPAPATSP
jgi:signal transduction histidine kinase